MGGEGREGVFGDLWACERLSDGSFQWRLVNNDGPRLYDHQAISHEGHIWVFGGVNGGHGTTSDCLYRFNLEAGSWEQVGGGSSCLVMPRSRHQLVLVDDRLVLLGGCGVAGPNDYVSHVAVFNLATECWETCQPSVAEADADTPASPTTRLKHRLSGDLGLSALVHRWNVDESAPPSAREAAELEAGVLWQNSLFSHQVCRSVW